MIPHELPNRLKDVKALRHRVLPLSPADRRLRLKAAAAWRYEILQQQLLHLDQQCAVGVTRPSRKG